jgi:Tfp pilus assembly protein PilN
LKTAFKRSGVLNWLDQHAVSKRQEKKNHINIVPRGLYKEHRRTYKANALELIRLIRNEARVYGRSGLRVVWRCRQISNNHFSVLYAVLDAQAEAMLSKGWQLVLPETWLLYELLNTDTLYQIQSGDPYWAWLKPDHSLQITSMKGLMQEPRYFLDAIGVPSAEVQSQHLDLRALTELPKSAIKALDYVGLSVWHQLKSESRRLVPWRMLLGATAVLFGAYAVFLSLGLSYQEQRLSEQVATLQAEANDVFQRQRELEDQMAVLSSYQQYFNRFPGAYPLLGLLSEQLKDKAELRTINLSGPLVQISGTADSATEVFSTLAAQAVWSEVKFDRNIQRNKDKEVFTLSMVYRAANAAAMPADQLNQQGQQP